MSQVERPVKKIYVFERYCSPDGSVRADQDVFVRLSDALNQSVNMKVVEFSAPLGMTIKIASEVYYPYKEDSATGLRFPKFTRISKLLERVAPQMRTAVYDSIEHQVADGGFGPDEKDEHLKVAQDTVQLARNILGIAKGSLVDHTMFQALDEAEYKRVKAALAGKDNTEGSRYTWYADNFPGCEGFRQPVATKEDTRSPKQADARESAALVEFCRHKLSQVKLPYNAPYLNNADEGLQRVASFVRKAFSRQDKTEIAYLLNQACDEIETVDEVLASTADMLTGFEKSAPADVVSAKRMAKMESIRAIQREEEERLYTERRRARQEEIEKARANGYMWG
jgi:hypothetical protein